VAAQTYGGTAVIRCIAVLPKSVWHDSIVQNKYGKLGPLALVLRFSGFSGATASAQQFKAAMLTNNDRTLRPKKHP